MSGLLSLGCEFCDGRENSVLPFDHVPPKSGGVAMKRVFNLVDASFGQAPSITGGKVPQYWHWDRSFADPAIPIFYTNGKIFEAIPGRENYAILTEPRALMGAVYANAPQVMDRFRYVFTHDSVLLNAFPDQCKVIPAGGLWVGGDSGGGKIKLYPKSKKVSIVSSTKSMCELHLFRYQLAVALRYWPEVDVFMAHPGHNHPIINSLAEYRYSIAVENHVDDYYFTEKLLNCFATGTVPVYLGAQRIGDFFDADGVIPFTTWHDLVQLLPQLTEQDYKNRSKAVEHNFATVKGFDNNEDFIAARYGDLLPVYPFGS